MSAAFYILLIKALVALCWASSLADPEEAVRDFSEHILAIPNAEKVLNSVLGQLEHNQQVARQRFLQETECDEILPEYTESLQGRERDVDQLKHLPICNLKRKIRRLNTNEYEYRPAYYEEVLCVTSGEEKGVSNGVCSGLGLSCVQWNKTIHLTRRRYTSDCWETRTLVIPAGCECLWPAHKLGDMSLHL
ncbi:uncharacterized protein isoform X2 [Choristoneura fumiferana]|uniref:uncharacterized protein isoform X2 n=1 Tax=Choristoneura fumiferana TaxID=7141 RepID=UPI003D15956B